MLRKTVDRAECTVEFDWYLQGSVLRGTVEAGTTECRTEFLIDSPETEEDILRIIRLAKKGCFAEQMVQSAVLLVSSYVINGRRSVVSLEDDGE